MQPQYHVPEQSAYRTVALQQPQQQPIQLNPQVMTQQPMPQQVYAVNMQGSVQYSQGVSPMIQYAQPTVIVGPQLQPVNIQYPKPKPPKKKGLIEEISDAIFGEPRDEDLPTWIYRSKRPTRFRCAKCDFKGKSKTEFAMGNFAWCMVFVFLLFFFPFACLPCCLVNFKDIVHYCPRCNQMVGRVKQGGSRRGHY